MKFFTTLLAVLFSLSLFGADTTETFDLGFSDYEYYYGVSGLKQDEKTFSSEFTIGVGITESLSSTITLGSERVDGKSSVAHGFGLFYTAYDSDMFDFDVYGSMSDSLEFTLGVELNLDFKKDLELAGLYMRAEANVLEEYEGLALTFGGYFTVTESLQTLLEFDLGIPSEGDMEIGGVVLGVNYVISDRFELITDFTMDIPQDDEELDFAFSLGFIATIP